ncbi:MAG: hypothetical protein AAB532_00595 [Patescibacteria group bacterium]
MDKNGQIGELLEKGQTTVTNSVQDTANTVRTQVLGGQNNSQSLPNQNPDLPPQIEPVQADNTDYTKQAVSSFYSPSENGEPNSSEATETDEQKLARVRQDLDGEKQKHKELHDEVYYQPLIAYEQKQATQQQERPAEVAENEKQHDLQEHVEKQAKKDQDIATQRAQRQIEIKGGVSG